MSLDLLIPFGILLIMVIYLIYSRNSFEKDITSLYEKKFDEWKKHSTIEVEKTSHKELVGLVYKTDYKVSIELLDENVQSALTRGKFEVSNLGRVKSLNRCINSISGYHKSKIIKERILKLITQKPGYYNVGLDGKKSTFCRHVRKTRN